MSLFFLICAKFGSAVHTVHAHLSPDAFLQQASYCSRSMQCSAVTVYCIHLNPHLLILFLQFLYVWHIMYAARQ